MTRSGMAWTTNTLGLSDAGCIDLRVEQASRPVTLDVLDQAAGDRGHSGAAHVPGRAAVVRRQDDIVELSERVGNERVVADGRLVPVHVHGRAGDLLVLE